LRRRPLPLVTPKKKREDALEYHARGRAGKIADVPTKPLSNQRDLSLAYSPGVAEPCLEIQRDPEEAYRYTARGNLVAVVTNGTAVLGLGNIGALAGKPVMEGKGNLFKQFADIDVFDLEVNSENPQDVIRFCQLLEPSVGGINLEDIRAPECFEIEETLRKTMKIPVFHDDQHGTAIISGAALINALEVVGKKIDEVRVVFSGAGASAIATAKPASRRLSMRMRPRFQLVACHHRSFHPPMPSTRMITGCRGAPFFGIARSDGTREPRQPS
jgi:malate dehydrogenase (oxaloacetate-decarboxylating)(NADP+)